MMPSSGSKCGILTFPNNVPAHPHSGPVDNLEEGDNTEPEKETKEAAKRGDELNWPH